MLNEVEVSSDMALVILSDNCSSQYKSVQHFVDIKNLSQKYGLKIVRIYGVPEHGKNEIDCVGGG